MTDTLVQKLLDTDDAVWWELDTRTQGIKDLILTPSKKEQDQTRFEHEIIDQRVLDGIKYLAFAIQTYQGQQRADEVINKIQAYVDSILGSKRLNIQESQSLNELVSNQRQKKEYEILQKKGFFTGLQSVYSVLTLLDDYTKPIAEEKNVFSEYLIKLQNNDFDGAIEKLNYLVNEDKDAKFNTGYARVYEERRYGALQMRFNHSVIITKNLLELAGITEQDVSQIRNIRQEKGL